MFERILVATDGSAHAHRAIAAAAELASRAGGDVRVLHVREFGFSGRAGEDEPEEASHAHKVLDEAVEDLDASGIKASSALRGARVGHIAREILQEADASRATVIVMGSRGHSDLEGLVLGSTTHKVLHLGGPPVVVVR